MRALRGIALCDRSVLDGAWQQLAYGAVGCVPQPRAAVCRRLRECTLRHYALGTGGVTKPLLQIRFYAYFNYSFVLSVWFLIKVSVCIVSFNVETVVNLERLSNACACCAVVAVVVENQNHNDEQSAKIEHT